MPTKPRNGKTPTPRRGLAQVPWPPLGSSRTQLSLHVVGARPGTKVELTPGKTFLPLPPEDINTIALAELVPAGDGTFRAVARICPRWFKISRRDLRELKIPVSEMTMRRLVTAGFVRGELVTPSLMQFDFFSYLEHVRRTGDDNEFWDRTQPGSKFTNRQRYQQAL